MRWTKGLLPTLRQVPSDAVVPSHQLMLRAGLITQVAAGSYSYLPLGTRVLAKVMAIIRQEMDRAGAIEVFLPTLQPVEWWEQTGRRAAYGENLFVVTDRHGRHQALGPTHEEVVTHLIATFVESYRQLPLNVYQIQTKFRDEYRPRFGVLRSREFQMKDAYSFDLTLEGLDRNYEAMHDAYCRIFDRCGLDYRVVEAEAGPIGGDASHEFMVPCATGEDTILVDDATGYAANVEKCETGARPIDLAGEPVGAMQDIETPNCAAITDLCASWPKLAGSKLKASNAVKSVLFRAEIRRGEAVEHAYWQAMVRGDHEINVNKLQKVIEGKHLGEMAGDDAEASVDFDLMPEDEVRRYGIPVGYIGPDLKLDSGEAAFTGKLHLAVDYDLLRRGFWVTGANRHGWHKKCFDWGRDFVERMAAAHGIDTAGGVDAAIEALRASGALFVGDIRNAVAGDPSPKVGGGTLGEFKGLEVGHIFRLGTKYSQAMGCTVSNEKGESVYPIMGCYGIGVNRIIAAAIECPGGRDEAGIIWPMSIAPYQVVITTIKHEGRVAEVVEALYAELTASGLEVLLDDRAERPGVKFKDADLIGIPLRVTIGEKGLANDEVELKARVAEKAEMVGRESVSARVVEQVRAALASDEAAG